MQVRNTEHAYGSVAIVMHWLMALAIFGMFALGLWMRTLDYYDAWYHRAPYIHKSVGMLLLFLLIFRLVWLATNAKPAIIGKPWEQISALAVHRMHYVLMVIIMLTGYLIPTAKGIGVDVFDWFTVPAMPANIPQQADVAGIIHLWSAWMLIGLALLHSGAALKHHFVDRDETLLRMFGIQQTKQGDDL